MRWSSVHKSYARDVPKTEISCKTRLPANRNHITLITIIRIHCCVKQNFE